MKIRIELKPRSESMSVLELEEGGFAYFGSRDHADGLSPYAVVEGVDGYRILSVRKGRVYVKGEASEEREVSMGETFIPLVLRREGETTKQIAVPARVVPERPAEGAYPLTFTQEDIDTGFNLFPNE